MDLTNNLDILSVGIATAASLLLGFIVFLNGRKSETNRVFFLLALSAIFYGVFNYTSYKVTDQTVAILILRYVIFSAVWYAFFLFQFFFIFPSDNVKYPAWYRFLLVPVVLVTACLTLSPYVFSGATIVENRTPVVHAGPAAPLFGVVSGFLVAGAIFLLFRKMRRAQSEEKMKYRIIFVGTSLTFPLYIVFNMIFPLAFDNVRFVPLASLFSFPFLAFTSYAVIKHKLLDIKVVSTEVLTFVLAVSVLFEAILSDSIGALIFRIGVFLLVLGVGLMLIKSVRKEIEQKEQLADIATSLERANLRLQELDKQKTEFLSIASHQLRTPLSIIKGYIELIEDGAYGKPSKALRETLGNMDETNERLVKLIDEFLDISRIEQGRTKFNFSTYKIDDVVESVVKEITDRAKDKGLALEWKPGKLGESIMDEEKIRHVVFNFVDNAIKYSEKGTINVSIAGEKNGIAVRVKDEGLGFNKADEASFYQKFYRGENVKGVNVGGTGLGLYVCRKFIESHGGRVWAKSEGLGKGGEFGFWIPKNPPPQTNPT